VASRESRGSRMLAQNLREEGFEIGRDRTRRLMKVLNLKVKQKRKRFTCYMPFKRKPRKQANRIWTRQNVHLKKF